MSAKKLKICFGELPIEIDEGASGRRVKATLAVCPECNGQFFLMYFPETVNHCHFQCVACGVSFCHGGCTAAAAEGGKQA